MAAETSVAAGTSKNSSAAPKKASTIETDLDFDAVQSIGLDAGLVGNKSAAIDDLWQAVRFVYRLEDR